MERNIMDIKKELQGKWLAIRVTKETDDGESFGELVAHNIDRRELHKELREKKLKVFISLLQDLFQSRDMRYCSNEDKFRNAYCGKN